MSPRKEGSEAEEDMQTKVGHSRRQSLLIPAQMLATSTDLFVFFKNSISQCMQLSINPVCGRIALLCSHMLS